MSKLPVIEVLMFKANGFEFIGEYYGEKYRVQKRFGNRKLKCCKLYYHGGSYAEIPRRILRPVKDPQKRYQTLAPPREVVYQLWMDEKGILDRAAQERQLTEDSLRTAKQEKRKATQEQLQKEQEKSHATKARVEAVRAQMRAKGMMVESSGSAMPNDKSTESANRPSSRNQPMAFPRYEPYGDKRKRQPANVFSDPRSKEAMDAAREAQRHWRPQSPERYTDTTALDYLDEGAWDETQQSTDRDRLYVAQIASLDPEPAKYYLSSAVNPYTSTAEYFRLKECLAEEQKNQQDARVLADYDKMMKHLKIVGNQELPVQCAGEPPPENKVPPNETLIVGGPGEGDACVEPSSPYPRYYSRIA